MDSIAFIVEVVVESTITAIIPTSIEFLLCLPDAPTFFFN